MPKALVRPLFACLLLAFIAAYAGPIEIVLANIHELDYGFSSHLGTSFSVFIAASSAMLLLFVVTFQINRRIFRALEVVFLAIIVLTLINKTLLYGDYGAFDGRGLDIDTLSVLTALQLMVAVALLTVFWRKRNLLSIALAMSALYTTITLAIAFSAYASGGDRQILTKHPFPVAKEYFQFSKSAPNYLYIVLDEVYGGSAREIFESDAIAVDSFNGFTFYTDVAGVYPTTIASIPAILNGSLYQNRQAISDYIANSFASSRLFNSLKQKKYPAYIHTSGMYCQHVDLESCSNMGDMLPSQQAADQEYGTALDLSIFKMAPEFLKPLVYNEGNWLFEDILARSGGTRRGSFQVDEFRYLIDEINANGSGPSFKFYHNTVTHSPIKLDANCNLLVKNRPPAYKNYLEQDKCGFSLIQELMDKLQELGIYDNTFIVISSDHGRPFVPSRYEKLFAESDSGASHKQYGYAHATLMVKPLHTREALTFSDSPMSLLDVGGLLHAAVEDPENNEPINVNTGERPFHYYYWSKKYFDWKQNALPPFESVYLLAADVSAPSSWRENTEQLKLVVEGNIRQPLKCGQPILFAGDQYQELYSSSGLSLIEPWGRWSEGGKVRLYFRGDALACQEQRIRMDLKAYLRKNKPKQYADMLFNGKKIGEVAFQRGEEKRKEIVLDIGKGSYLVNEINTIELAIADPVSPAELGESSDTRNLAIGLISFEEY